MARAKPKCLACEKPMEEGYVFPPWPLMPLTAVRWMKGRPQSPADFSVTAKGAKPLAVTAWRCAGCGRLESYAN